MKHVNKGLDVECSSQKKTGTLVLVLLSIVLVLLILIFGLDELFQAKIVINEICSNNGSWVLDQDGLIEDYIELYNAGNYSCKLDGLYLSDDVFDLKKISLDGEYIPAGGFIIVVCEDSKNSFSINNKGETIYLSDANGKILESVEVKSLAKDTAYVRTKNQLSSWEIGDCSPNRENNVGNEEKIIREGLIRMPQLSHSSGFYDSEFNLEIISEENTIVYYSIDGSLPDEESYVYKEPIRVYDRSEEPSIMKSQKKVVREWLEYNPEEEVRKKAFVIRVVAVDSDGRKSDVVTATYFIGMDEYKNENAVSLVVDPKDLFNDEDGIYVTGSEYDEWYINGKNGDRPIPNFRQKGKEWEKKATFELFENEKSLFQQNVGVRIQGAGSREAALKRFSIYARKAYSGTNTLDYALFGNDMLAHSIAIREPVADVICQELMEERGIPYLRSRKINLFLNGEFWYSSYLREKYNEKYFHDYYGIDEDNLIVIEGDGVGCGVETDRVLFNEFMDYVAGTDFSLDDTYKELENRFDIQSYIDFMVTNLYCSNLDVDFKKMKNVVMWRSRNLDEGEYGDCKWRFALYDMDSVAWNSKDFYQVENRAQINSFSQQPEHAELPYNTTSLFVALKQNQQFQKQFVLTFLDIMNTNFSVDNVDEVLKRHYLDSGWNEGYFEKRPTYAKQYLAEEFGLEGTTEKVTIINEDSSEGTVTINTIVPAMDSGVWTGEYFTDYPIIVSANPAEGYQFVGWSGSITSSETTIEVPVVAGGIELQAKFEKSTN